MRRHPVPRWLLWVAAAGVAAFFGLPLAWMLSTALKGDADAVKITMAVARNDFHNGRPWTVDGSRLVAGA